MLAFTPVTAGDFAEVLELEVVGTRLTAFINGAQVTQVTDGGLTVAGRGGIFGSGPAEAPATIRVFDFEVVDYTNPIRMAG